MEKITEKIKELIKEAKVEIKNGRELIPSFTFYEYDKKECKTFKFPFRDDTEKEYIFSLVKKVLESGKIREYIFISEGWYLSQKEGEEMMCRPSEHPNKQECISLYYQDFRGQNEIRMIPFARKDDEIIFEKEMKTKNQKIEGTVPSTWR